MRESISGVSPDYLIALHSSTAKFVEAADPVVQSMSIICTVAMRGRRLRLTDDQRRRIPVRT